MEKYLDGKKDFTFTNREEVARELEMKMMAFMDKKVKKLIHAAKLKHHSFKEDYAGDEFRLYSNNNTKLF